MNRKNIVVVVMFVAGMAGCATSTHVYIQPQSYQVETERVISIPFDKFWDMYVAELSKSFFVINNIEKESRIINISFSASIPNEYIDCGRSNRTFSEPLIGNETFNYEVANGSSYMVDDKRNNLIIWTIDRYTALEGRVNIFMAPEDSSTLLRVNVLYVWTSEASGISLDMNRTYRSGTVKNAFSSGEEGSAKQEGTKVLCRSKGNLERVLLNLVEATKL